MTILAYQLVIVLSLILVRAIARSYLTAAAVAWTVFTFVAVFTSPLLILQLATIWGSHILLSPRDGGSPSQQSSPPATRRRPVARDRSTSTLAAASTNAGAASAVLFKDAMANGRGFLSKAGTFINGVAAHMDRATAIEETTGALKNAVEAEQTRIDIAVALEREQREHADYLRGLGPEKAALHKQAWASLESELEARKGPPRPIDEIDPPDFSAVSAKHADPDIEAAIAGQISYLQETREAFLARTVNAIWHDTSRRRQVKDTLQRLGGAKLWPGLEAAAARLPDTRTARASPAATRQADALPATPPPPVPAAPTPAAQLVRLGDILAAAWNDTVQAQAQARGIQHLVHFTRVENLPQILQHGIRPIADLEAGGIAFHANDGKRLDGRRNASSLSISHPNDKMFARYRWQDKAQDWAVLVLDPSILWTKKVAFCSHNAADKRISKTPLANLMHPPAFEAMFLEKAGLPSRDENQLRAFDPTDVQAELLVMDVVPPALIRGVIFSHVRCLQRHAASLGAIPLSVGEEGKGYFGARAYARKAGWGH